MSKLTVVSLIIIILINIFLFSKTNFSHKLIGIINIIMFLLFLMLLKFKYDYKKAKKREEEMEVKSFFEAVEEYRKIFK